MKKLLVLMLVLGVASLASAALTVTVEGSASVGSTFNVVISGVVPGDFAYYRFYDVYEGFGVGSDYGDFTGNVTYVDNGDGFNAAGNLSGSFSYDAGYDGLEMTLDDLDDEEGAGLNDPVTGAWVKLEVTGVAAGDMVIGNFASDYGSYTEVGTITIVPEPATLALLGLGGLLLRRKK